MRTIEQASAAVQRTQRVAASFHARRAESARVSELADVELNGNPGSRWATALIGACAVALCLPALLGCLGAFMPGVVAARAATWRELATFSPPATVVGLALGGWAILRARGHTTLGRTLAALLVATVLLSLAFSMQVIWLTRGAGR